VGQTKVARDSRRLKESSLLPRRELAQKISQGGIDVGFIEGGPVNTQIAQSLQHMLCEPLKKTNGFRRREPASVFKPQRVGKMVEGHKRPDAAPAKRLKHGAVAAERSQVPTALFGFDPAPLKREPQRVDAKPLRAVKVLLRVAPPVASQAGVVARL